MAWAISAFPTTIYPPPPFSHSSSLSFLCHSLTSSVTSTSTSTSSLYKQSPHNHSTSHTKPIHFHIHPLLVINNTSQKLICRAAEYKFPDPIPEFAEAETERFRTHLLDRLSKKDYYGDSIDEIVGICTEIFTTFLHTEYGGPGTLLVIPFIDMADTLNERGLPGGPQAARVAVKWAQNHVDKDWKEWNSNGSIQ